MEARGIHGKQYAASRRLQLVLKNTPEEVNAQMGVQQMRSNVLQINGRIGTSSTGSDGDANGDGHGTHQSYGYGHCVECADDNDCDADKFCARGYRSDAHTCQVCSRYGN